MYTKVFYDKCSNSLASRCILKYIFRTCTVLTTHRFDSTAIRTVNREKIRKDWIYFWSEGELESNYSGVDLLTGGSLKFSVGPAIIFALFFPRYRSHLCLVGTGGKSVRRSFLGCPGPVLEADDLGFRRSLIPETLVSLHNLVIAVPRVKQ